MEILILDEPGLRRDHETLVSLAGFVLESEGAPETTELSVALVGGEEMAGLNEKYLGRPGPTDVLSFYMGERSEDVFILGDVIVCPEEAAKRRESYGFGESDELLLVLTHGILHLMGYDDETEEDNRKMDERQRMLLATWKESGR